MQRLNSRETASLDIHRHTNATYKILGLSASAMRPRMTLSKVGGQETVLRLVVSLTSYCILSAYTVSVRNLALYFTTTS